MVITWTGPYGWPQYESENGLGPIPDHSGLYLQCFSYKDEYVIYAAGLTRRSIPVRIKEHTRKYMSGDYTVLDLESAENCVRKEIWHGWGWTYEKRLQFESGQESIREAANTQLAGFKLFVSNVPSEDRILERLEAAIMNELYELEKPYCDLPDRGMMLAPIRPDEKPISVTNVCHHHLYGLPTDFDI